MDKLGYPKRLKRSESFFGLHFDFHAEDVCMEIGKNTTEEMIDEILIQSQPDYVQCDCKGHRGFSSYPTKVGNPAPGVVRDSLRLWREVTARRGVALFMHYSGVWDTEALKHNPDWACINADGKSDVDITSLFGQYVDMLLIPQLKELCEEYQVDGVWIDGECWAAKPDFCDEVLRRFNTATGAKSLPQKPEEPYYFEFMEICREGFRNYLRHYVQELHRFNPDFQIASNWAFTSFMPEPVSAEIDFISGDYTPQNSMNSARLEGRCIARQGKPWDLMAWSFSNKPGCDDSSTKTPLQLKQEAAVVLSLGGGFQVYFMQKPDGAIVMWQTKLMKEVAVFCRARQEFCHRAEAVPQIGLLYYGKAFYKKNKRLFSHWDGDLVPMQGILNCLLDSQNCVEILMEHHLIGRIEEYPLIIIPEWEYLEEKFICEILSYVENGGNLLVIGAGACRLFEKELGVIFTASSSKKENRWLEYNGWLAGIKSIFQSVHPSMEVETHGALWHTQDNKGEKETAGTITAYGKGRIGGIYFNFGEKYHSESVTVIREFLKSMVNSMFQNPLVEVTGSRFVDVTVNRKDGKLMINLVNTTGLHSNLNVLTYDEVPPVGPIYVSISCGQTPKKVVLQPEGALLQFTYKEGKLELTLEKLDIHNIVVIEE